MSSIPGAPRVSALRLDRIIDAALVVAAPFVASIDQRPCPWRGALRLALVCAAVWPLASRVLRQYDADNGRGYLGDVALTLVMWATIVGIGASASILGMPFLAPSHVARLAAIATPVSLVARWFLVDVPLRRSRPPVHVLVVGIGPLGRHTGNEIDEAPRRHRVMGYLRFVREGIHARLHAPLLGTADELDAILRKHVVDEVYLASTAHEDAASVQAAIAVCELLGTPFALPACSYRLGRAKPVASAAFADGYVHFLNVQGSPVQLAMKRAFDIALSGSALVLLSPLLVLVALAILLTSRGPVLFRQPRVGLRGRTFHMLKFRSMVANAEELAATLVRRNEQLGPVFKMRCDPRVTAVGRFIRKHSIDELAQLVNVLRGDMSIVGPRPPLPREVDRYEGWQRRRLSVRPGLTCVWQVSGRNLIAFERWMQLDLSYIDHWTLATDLSLIMRTMPVIFSGRGAS